MHIRGRVRDTSKYVRKKVPFCTYFVIFSCKVILPYFFVFGVEFHYCFLKHLLQLFSRLSNVSVFFSRELLIGYFRTFPLEMGEEVR